MINYNAFYATKLTPEDLLWQEAGNNLLAFESLKRIQAGRMILNSLPAGDPVKEVVYQTTADQIETLQNRVPISDINGKPGTPIRLEPLENLEEPRELQQAS